MSSVTWIQINFKKNVLEAVQFYANEQMEINFNFVNFKTRDFSPLIDRVLAGELLYVVVLQYYSSLNSIWSELANFTLIYYSYGTPPRRNVAW